MNNHIGNMAIRYAKSPILEAVEGYRILCEFDNVVLAFTPNGSGEYCFTTWQRDYDGKGVHWGHYYMEDYEGAKIDFVKRAFGIEAAQPAENKNED